MRAGAAPSPRDPRDPRDARVFFALWPDAAARAALAGLAAEVVRRGGGRAPADANLHLTLAFVGAVAPERRETLLAAGHDAAAQTAPFTLVLDRLGAFRDAGVAWIGTSEPPPALTDLAARLAHALCAHGFDIDRRPYAPHLTLARKCKTPPHPVSAPRVAWEARELTLVESALRPGGPVYRIASRWPLAGTAAPGR
jgi:2'-5' RNA ligase